MKPLLLSAALVLFATALHAEVPAISFTAPQAYPESVTWSDNQDVFFLGSVAKGTIGKLDLAGRYATFIQPKDLPSTFGVRVDDARNRLWVTAGDLGTSETSSPETTGKMALVVEYDAQSGAELARYDLMQQDPGPHLANDVALDDQGQAYVTDSFAHVIWRIDAAGQISAFARSPLFDTGEGYGLNGIVVHPDGYLLVGAFNSGELFRIDLKDPSKVSKVQMPTLPGIDGFTLKSPTQIVAALSGFGADGAPARAVEIESQDGWQTARVAATKQALSSFPASATTAEGAVWVLNTRLDTLMDPKAAKVDDFVLQNFDLSQD